MMRTRLGKKAKATRKKRKQGRNVRPTIENLRKFAREYLPKVGVVWARSGSEFLGRADTKKKIIRLNPEMPLRDAGYLLGDGWQTRESQCSQLRMVEGEQYFMTLLHEIGHFRRHLEVPQYYERLRREIVHDYPDEREMQEYVVEDRVKRRNGESDAKLQWRISDIRCYILFGIRMAEHMAVGSWAVREFKRRRKRISELIRQSPSFRQASSASHETRNQEERQEGR